MTYPSDLSDAQYSLIENFIPLAKPGGRKRTTDVRLVLNAIFYLLRTGCQWRMLPKDFPPWITVYSYYRSWERQNVWTKIYRYLYPAVRKKGGKSETPSIGIMDSQTVKTTEKGGQKGMMATRRSKGLSVLFS